MEQNKSRGRRYTKEAKLNYGKIIAVIIAFAVIIMFILAIKHLLSYNINKFTAKKEYFALYSENKWGIINSLGETVIAPSYAEMIVVPDNTKDIFLCIYDIDTKSGTYKTKAIDSKNKEIFTEYEQIEAIENYDKNQNTWYEENDLKVKKGGKYGLINLKGNSVLNCKYDNIYALKGIKNSLIIEDNGKLGLADNSGRIVIEPSCEAIEPLGKDALDGYITKKDGKYGVVGANKTQKLDNNYEKIEKINGNSLFVIVEQGKQKLINTEGETILEEGFDKITQIIEGSNQIIFVKDGTYGIMTTEGEIKIPNQYESLEHLSNGYLIAKQNGKYGIIDSKNTTRVYFNYNSISYNEDANIYIAEDTNFKSSIIDKQFQVKLMGILSELNTEAKYIKMRIQNEYKYYNFDFEEKENTQILKGNTLYLSNKNGKYGYVNSEGEVIIDYIYDDATEQNSFGFVAVQKGGKWGSIDSEGKVVIEPKYKLDNNIIINFIGKWHLGEDLNMNYYCDK